MHELAVFVLYCYTAETVNKASGVLNIPCLPAG